MTEWVWVPATIAAATFQVGRNALQRGVMGTSGPWGATLVRFLFGLPFSLLFVLLALPFAPGAQPDWSGAFWVSAMTGAASQILATAALLAAMHRCGFALGTALQQSSLPLTALAGLVVYHEGLSGAAWAGVAVATAGLTVLSWPDPRHVRHDRTGVALGLLSGFLFGLALNAFRHASLALDSGEPVFAALVTVAVVQAMQTVALVLFLVWRDPAALRDVLRRWRPSLGAGLCGACASAGWFVALALAPAAPVRALGTIEAPIAALAGHRLFRERVTLRQMVAGAAICVGVALTAMF